MNWGKGLAIAMIAFILFIVGMGVVMHRNSESLYDEDYFKQGENHTEIMRMKQNGLKVSADFVHGVLQISLPEPGTIQKITMKNMADASLDRRLKNVDGAVQRDFSIQIDNLQPGNWHVQILGIFNGESFAKRLELIID